jgi:hypothetical protein
VAFQIAQAFFPELAPKPLVAAATFDAATYDPKQFDQFTGSYPLDAAPQFVLTFTRAGDTLYTQATGQMKLRLRPTSDTSFAVQGVPASVEFIRDAAKKVTGAVLVQGGARQKATRQSAAVVVAAPWRPTVAELNALSGRYYSEELETYWEFVVSDGKLVVKHRRLSDIPLTATTKDTFSGGAFTLTLERDRSGQAIGFYANATRSRDIRFARVR